MTQENRDTRDSNNSNELHDDAIQEIHQNLIKNKELPKEGFSFLPIALIFLFAGVCFWGGIHIVTQGGEFRWDGYHPDFVAKDEALSIPEKSLFEIGEKVFLAQCAQCHQVDGQGIAGVYPPLVDSKWVLDHQEVLARILINGMNGKVIVLGKTYNGNMPAFGPSGLNLKPKQIAGVLTYIRQEWGNDGSEVTEDTMKNYMAMYNARTTPWTSEELYVNLSPEPEAPTKELNTDTSDENNILDTHGDEHHTDSEHSSSNMSDKEQT